jgi:hypothetical protein
MITTRTTRFNIQKFYVLPKQWNVCVLCTDFRTNIIYVHNMNSLVFYN